ARHLFHFWNYARRVVPVQFERYAVVSAKRVAERNYHELERHRQQVGREAAQIEASIDQRQAEFTQRLQELQTQIDAVDQDLQQIPINKQADIRDLEARNRDQRLQAFLKQHTIDKSKTGKKVALPSGFGKSRLEALHGAGIGTAADLNGVNERAALEALQDVRGADPEGEWAKLLTWREAIEDEFDYQILPNDPAVVTIENGFKEIEDALKQQRATLEAKLEAAQQDRIFYNNQRLREEKDRLGKLQADLDDLTRQADSARQALERYRDITPEALLNLMRSRFD
ncbi:MAG: hypothetical protein GYB67_14390, partial [Chloroflexi bacterium]|nr:hypothetical protein [Chloroflexota bacterium]